MDALGAGPCEGVWDHGVAGIETFKSTVHDHVTSLTEISPEAKMEEPREATFFFISCFKYNKNING